MSTTDTTVTTATETVYTVTCGPWFTVWGHDAMDFTAQWEGDAPVTKDEFEALIRENGSTELEWVSATDATAVFSGCGADGDEEELSYFALEAVERCPGCADWLTADDRHDDAGRCRTCAQDAAFEAFCAVDDDDDEPGEAPEALEVPTTADHLGAAVADAISSISYALELIDPAERVKRGQMLAARSLIEAAFPSQADEADEDAQF